ncbi:hypothetical protein ABT039_34760 [Streptomyces lasiicapitis]|uniref:Uncharacterized protein n=1 Tax=Streptomyces spectabilis TaxID=68270 RepID=A0A516R9X1_STRST|nr:hypothetical protein FH965_19405 [Streptomyces spectabilis]
MIYEISADYAPPIGDVRELSAGDELHLMQGWKQREDWIRYLAAVAHAMARGCIIRQGADLG